MRGGPSLRSALQNVPDDIRSALEAELTELERRFARGDWKAAELNGGRFAEAVMRYLEWKRTGSFTPVGKQLNRTSILKAVETDTTLPEGLRFHVRRSVELLMDVRNKRDVAHLGNVVDVEEMDARLVLRLANWTISEIIRTEGALRGEDIQKLVDRFSTTHMPLVEEIDGDLVLLATDLPAALRALIVLYDAYPDPVRMGELRRSVRYGNVTRFRRLLEARESEGLVYIKDDKVYLTRKGVEHVEVEVEISG